MLRLSTSCRHFVQKRRQNLVGISWSWRSNYLASDGSNRKGVSNFNNCFELPGPKRLRTFSVQTVISTETVTEHSRLQEENASQNGFSLSKRCSEPPEMPKTPDETVEQKEHGFSRWSLYFSAAGAALLIGGILMVPVEEKHDPSDSSWGVGLAISTIQEFAAEIGNKTSSIVERLLNRIKNAVIELKDASATTIVLFQCIKSVLESYGEGAEWWRPRVAAFLADLTASGEKRRLAVVSSGNGAVVDWLLEAVGKTHKPKCSVTESEAARALAHLLSDENTCESVLARPHALPHLLHFAGSLQANIRPQHHKPGVKFPGAIEIDNIKGKRQLVEAIMDIITTSCDATDEDVFRPRLPATADPLDIAAVLEVIREGGLRWDDENDGNDGGKSGEGIGLRVLGSTSIVGLHMLKQASAELLLKTIDIFPKRQLVNVGSSVMTMRNHGSYKSDSTLFNYGLWDDLQGRYVAVPLAAWALATWAEASSSNRNNIAKLDNDGEALLAAVLAPERTVKWHGATSIRLLLQSRRQPPDEVMLNWSSALLNMTKQACNHEDSLLAECALSAFTACIKQSKSMRQEMLETSLPLMRELARETEQDPVIQRAWALALDAISETGSLLSSEENKKWSSILLRWTCSQTSDELTRKLGSVILAKVVDNLGQKSIPITQAWLAMMLIDIVKTGESAAVEPIASMSKEAKTRDLLKSQATNTATQAATHLASIVSREAAFRDEDNSAKAVVGTSAAELPMADLLGLADHHNLSSTEPSKDKLPRISIIDAIAATQDAIKALTEISAESSLLQQRIVKTGGLYLLRRLLVYDDYEQWSDVETSESLPQTAKKEPIAKNGTKKEKGSPSHVRKHAARLLLVLTQEPAAANVIAADNAWCSWLENCADGRIKGCADLKVRSYARMALLNVLQAKDWIKASQQLVPALRKDFSSGLWPHYEDMIFLLNIDSRLWRSSNNAVRLSTGEDVSLENISDHGHPNASNRGLRYDRNDKGPAMDVVFIHGLAGGPFNTWRVAENKTSTAHKGKMVEKIDEQAGKEGTCWPYEWLSKDLPESRLITVKYKTNFSEWSGATLPLEGVSSMLLHKLLAAGVGDRPVVFVTHSMGGLVVKQMLLDAAKDLKCSHLVNKTMGIVFYSCPHFGSKLADMPWRIGYVLRPAPSIAELRSGSPKLEELNRVIRTLHNKDSLQVLSFSETKVTPLVEGYGGWALRMEVVPIESAYPGFGELVVLDGTDHVNSCKPLNKEDPAYTKILEFLQRLQYNAQEKQVGKA